MNLKFILLLISVAKKGLTYFLLHFLVPQLERSQPVLLWALSFTYMKGGSLKLITYFISLPNTKMSERPQQKYTILKCHMT